MVDADYADRVVAITDCLVPFPNFPTHISMTKVDYVVVVDAIGDPKKIATGAAKSTKDMRKTDDGGLLYTICHFYPVL